MIRYNKKGEVVKSGRMLYSGGPRDRQVKLAEQNTLNSFKHLREDLHISNDVKSQEIVTYSEQQLQDIVNKSVEDISIELEKKYLVELEANHKLIDLKDAEITKLMKTISVLENKLDKRDNIILELTTKVSNMLNNGNKQIDACVSTDDDKTTRPSMDKIFIDPTIKGVEDKYESHVVVDEEQSKKDNVANSVNKLKALMGGKSPKI